jgi:hypothetical protein
MAIIHDTAARTDIERPYKDAPTADLVMWLEMQMSEGRPYDDMMVFEVASRALDAEDLLAAPLRRS